MINEMLRLNRMDRSGDPFLRQIELQIRRFDRHKHPLGRSFRKFYPSPKIGIARKFQFSLQIATTVQTPILRS